MSEGNVPKPKVPTTSTQITGPEELWDEYFGDAEEQQYMLTDVRQRHMAVLLQDGEKFYWLKRRQDGTECPYWDRQAGNCSKPLDPKATCYNTRWIGGYHSPMIIYVAVPSSEKKNLREDAGILKIQNMRLWTVHTPELTDRDMLVRYTTGERFEIQNMQESGTWRGNIIAQFFEVQPMQIGVHYGMNVPVEPVDR